jgi:hypothetical protein
MYKAYRYKNQVLLHILVPQSPLVAHRKTQPISSGINAGRRSLISLLFVNQHASGGSSAQKGPTLMRVDVDVSRSGGLRLFAL